jgi:glucosamine-phosphate N-acetyltransferase
MSFRTLTTSYYHAYLALINEFRPTEFTESQFIDTLANIQKLGTIWVYEEEGQLLATGTIIYEHKFIMNTCVYAHVEDVCVRSTHRRKGVGLKLIHHLIDQSRHCYKFTLDCADSNIAFYEACGLEKRGNQMCQILINLK